MHLSEKMHNRNSDYVDNHNYLDCDIGSIYHGAMTELICPQCRNSDHTKAGLFRGTQMYRCSNCRHCHKPEDRQRRHAIENHARPKCPQCGDAHPRRLGIDYRYEKQAYHCRHCSKAFRIRMTRFAPVGRLDEIADTAVRTSLEFAAKLKRAGAFRLNRPTPLAATIPEIFAGQLAGEIYLTIIGDRDHRSIDEAISQAVALTNALLRKSEGGAVQSVRPPAPALSIADILKHSNVIPASEISLAAQYNLDRARAIQGLREPLSALTMP